MTMALSAVSAVMRTFGNIPRAVPSDEAPSGDVVVPSRSDLSKFSKAAAIGTRAETAPATAPFSGVAVPPLGTAPPLPLVGDPSESRRERAALVPGAIALAAPSPLLGPDRCPTKISFRTLATWGALPYLRRYTRTVVPLVSARSSRSTHAIARSRYLGFLVTTSTAFMRWIGWNRTIPWP